MKAAFGLLASSVALLISACGADPSTETSATRESSDEALAGSPNSAVVNGKLRLFHYPCDLAPGETSCWSIFGWEASITKHPFVRLRQGTSTMECVASRRQGVHVATLTAQRKTFVLQGVDRCDAPDTTAEPLGRLSVTASRPVTKTVCKSCDSVCDHFRYSWLQCWGDHFNEDENEQQNPNPCERQIEEGEQAFQRCRDQCESANTSSPDCAGSGVSQCGPLGGIDYMICRLLHPFDY